MKGAEYLTPKPVEGDRDRKGLIHSTGGRKGEKPERTIMAKENPKEESKI